FSPYIFATNNPLRFMDVEGEGPGDRIKAAKKYLGTSYKQQSETSLRTGTDEKALKYMDCSELVCRVIAADGLTSGIKHKNTSDLITKMSNTSKWHKSNNPQ